MELKAQEFAGYLRRNEGREYRTQSGTQFTFKVLEQPASGFPCSVHFSSPKWSRKTRRVAGASRIAAFLALFNNDPGASLDQFRNRGGRGSQAWVARYLKIVMQDARDELAQDGESG